MSKKNSTTKQNADAQQEAGKKRPSHRIFQIEDRGEGNKPFWREAGVCWLNKDGSLNLDFAVVPLIGTHTIQARPYDENQEQTN